MVRAIIVVTISLAPLVAANAEQAEKKTRNRSEKGFVSLFDGKSLEGWSGGNMKLFRVEDGAIVAGTMKEKIPNNEFLTFKDEYQNFELRLDAKLVGEGGNAGIQIRSRRPTKEEINSDDKNTKLPAHEMVGYQVDMGKAWKNIWWGKLYDESRRRKVLAGPEDEKQLEELTKWNDWNEYRIRAVGRRIQIWLNGTQTVNYVEKEKGIARTGLIGLQIHGGPPSEASYRNIRIKKIERKQNNKQGK